MSFDHPKTGEKMEFEQDIPEDYKDLFRNMEFHGLGLGSEP